MGERKPFLLRIDSDLWTDLEAWAQAELRSVNGQIEYLLREAVQKRKGSTSRPREDAEAVSPSAQKRSSSKKK
jgi:hypothetical protein